MRRNIWILLAALTVAACSSAFDPSSVQDATEGQIARVEPPCWWVGMKTPLQLMVYGEGIGAYDVTVEGKGVKLTQVHKAESPNYLFLDLSVAQSAPAGEIYLVFSREGESFKRAYTLSERREGSAQRLSFTTADMIYLIMPDRFANGDPSNDNSPLTSEIADRSDAFGRHGGDIQGIMDHLDYLSDLGITAIWNTPLLLDNDKGGTSYHGYSCADYYMIDPRFGGNEMYRELVQKCHEKGIKMIMDIVTNHAAADHWWMKDLPFEDWINQWPEYYHTNACFSTTIDYNASQIDRKGMDKGWFTETMVDMNLDNPYLLQYFKQWAVWWIEWADLDGFRVDTYPYNEKVPMSEWCKAVLAEYPNFNIVGECWTGSVPQLAYWQAGNPNKDGFDSHLPSIMDFPLQSAIYTAFPEDNVNWNEGLVRIYDCISHDFAYQDMSHMLVMSSNHDIGRLGDAIKKCPERQKLVMTLIATVRGIPQIFSGDEMMFCSSDVRDGDGGKRVDFPGGWQGDAFDLFTPEGRAASNVWNNGEPLPAGTYADLYDYVSKLFQWRKTAEVIHNGRTMHFLTRDNTYAYFRYNDAGQKVFVYLNNSHSAVTVPWSNYAEIASDVTAGRNVITGETVDFSAPVEVGPLQSLVVEF